MPRKQTLIDLAKALIIVVVVAMVAGVTGAFAVQRVIAKPYYQPPAISVLPAWHDYASGGQLIGSATAPKTIIEFSDFQCPFCAALQRTLEDVRHDRPTDVKIVYHHYPLVAAHPQAMPAARAAECAGDQGAFESFATLVFREQKQIGQSPWASVAARAGAGDTAAFATCLAESTTQARVDADMRLGRKLGIEGTPTVIVEGRLLRGLPSRQVIDSLLAEKAPGAR